MSLKGIEVGNIENCLFIESLSAIEIGDQVAHDLDRVLNDDGITTNREAESIYKIGRTDANKISFGNASLQRYFEVGENKLVREVKD